MDFKHAVINHVHTIVVETRSARTHIKGEEFRQFIHKKFPEANGDFLLLYKDIDNDYFFVETDDKLEKEGPYQHMTKMAWQADTWRPHNVVDDGWVEEP